MAFASTLGEPRARRRTSLYVALALTAACDPTVEPDGGAPDAGVLMDAGGDGGFLVDATAPDAGGAPPDAAADGGEPTGDDAGSAVDAGPPCTCAPMGECVTSSCEAGACVYENRPDGTSCGESVGFRCVGGACTDVVECGDGYREPGPVPEREACDDGNTLDGDACSMDCTPSVLVVQSRATETDVPGAAAIAESADGTVLFVWAASSGEDLQLLARRASAVGTPIDDHDAPIVVATGLGLAWDAHAVALGLGSGWVVAWAAPNGSADESDIAYVVVAAHGTVGPLRFANSDRRGLRVRPAIVLYGDGFLLAWEDRSGITAGFGRTRIEYGTFGPRGSATSEVVQLNEAGTSALEPALATNGTEVLAVWTREPASDDFESRGAVVGLRLGLDTDPFVISEVDGAQPAVTTGSGGDFAVVWVTRAMDTEGDVALRRVQATGAPTPDAATYVTLPPMEEPMTHAELAPSVVALPGDGLLVTYEDGGLRRGLTIAISGTPPPELGDLTPWLTDGLQGDATLLRASRGVWVNWSDASTRHGDGLAYRSSLAFLLAVD